MYFFFKIYILRIPDYIRYLYQIQTDICKLAVEKLLYYG